MMSMCLFNVLNLLSFPFLSFYTLNYPCCIVMTLTFTIQLNLTQYNLFDLSYESIRFILIFLYRVPLHIRFILISISPFGLFTLPIITYYLPKTYNIVKLNMILEKNENKRRTKEKISLPYFFPIVCKLIQGKRNKFG